MDRAGCRALQPSGRRWQQPGRSPRASLRLRCGPASTPTFAVVARSVHRFDPPRVQYPGISLDVRRVLYASQRIDLTGPLPTAAHARAASRITHLCDKGTAALVQFQTVVTALDGTRLWTDTSSVFAGGEGGFSGERVTAGPPRPRPDREPDRVIVTRPRRNRRCGIDRPVTATRCTPIPPTPRRPDTRARSCTGSVPTPWSPRP